MKKILLIITIILAIAGCKDADDFLDGKSDTVVNEQKVFADSILSMRFLIGIYQDAGFSFSKGRWDSHGNTEVATDDAEYAYTGPTQKGIVLYSGSVSPINFPFMEFWNLPYANIRKVNLYLSKLPIMPLSDGLKARTAAEAKFLRAWYYHYLLVSFGGIPLMEDKIYGLNDKINLPRSSFAECVNYLVKELDEAAAVLPSKNEYTETDYGRVTKGACMALKSRVLLYAASPLFNGGAETTDANLAAIVSYPSYDQQHWQDAANAAEAVINSGDYSLHVDNTTAPGYGFFQVFLKRRNEEYIFAFNRPQNKEMEAFYNPASRGGAKNTMPTQNIVDAFPMKNGKAITDPTSGYKSNNPYVNRDPRFYNTIIYNGAMYYLSSKNAKDPVYTYVDGGTDAFVTNSSLTGYYTRKMCDDNIAANSSFNTERGWPLIRYAEILLNYAEAINETGQTQLAYPKLIDLRKRAGIDPGSDNLYGLKPNMTKEEMREIIRNERRVELAFEDQRWNDIRRWKIAVETIKQFNMRMKITKSGSTYNYEIVPSIMRRSFRPEMYLMPIPDSEIRKMSELIQNPLW